MRGLLFLTCVAAVCICGCGKGAEKMNSSRLDVGSNVNLPLVLDGDRLGISSLGGSPPMAITGPGSFSDVHYDAEGHLLFVEQQGLEPDGFYRVEDGKAELKFSLPETNGKIWSPNWSPDESKVAWIDASGGQERLYVAEVGGEARQVGPDGIVTFFWSSGGESLIGWGNPGTYYVPLTTDAVLQMEDGIPQMWSPSGDVLLWVEEDPGRIDWKVVLEKADGSERRVLGGVAVAQGDGLPATSAFSPDGKWLAWDNAYAKDGTELGLVVAETDGSSITTLRCDACAPDSLALDPAWSPDGKRVAWSQDGHVLVAQTGIWEGQVVVEGNGPRWSPDGSRLSYVRKDGDSWSTYIALADGSGETKVVGDLLDWAPDGEHLVVTMTVSQKARLFSFEPSNGVLDELPLPEDAIEIILPVDSSPCVTGDCLLGSSMQDYLAPDGLSMVLDRTIVMADGSERKPEELIPGGGCDAWSPDSSTMLCVDKSGLKSLNLASGEVKTLQDGNITDPVWLPDAEHIAFVQDERLKVLDVATGETKMIAPDLRAAPAPANPVVTPDGRIIFATFVGQDIVTTTETNIYVIDADGNNLRQLTDTSDSKGYFEVSPDGKNLAYVSFSDLGSYLTVVDLETGEQKTELKTSFARFAWASPDVIVFSDNGKLSSLSVEGSVQPLVIAPGECGERLIGWVNSKAFFLASCGAGEQ